MFLQDSPDRVHYEEKEFFKINFYKPNFKFRPSFVFSREQW